LFKYRFGPLNVQVNFSRSTFHIEKEVKKYHSHVLLDNGSDVLHQITLDDWKEESIEKSVPEDTVIWNENKAYIYSAQFIQIEGVWDQQNLSSTFYVETGIDPVRPSDTSRFWEFVQRVSIYPILIRNKSIMLHCAGIVVDGLAYLFLGPSGAGKSTIASKAKQSGFQVITDDTAILSLDPKTNEWFVFSTPYISKSGFIGEDGHYKVGGFFILDQHPENWVEKVKRSDFTKCLLERIFETQYLCLVFSVQSKGLGREVAQEIIRLSSNLTKKYQAKLLHSNLHLKVADLFEK
jgi:hypothetical protein